MADEAIFRPKWRPATPEIGKWLKEQKKKVRQSRRFNGLRCTGFDCYNVELVWMWKDESRQTENGFLIARVDGWHCPRCAAGYGGMPPNAQSSPTPGGGQ